MRLIRRVDGLVVAPVGVAWAAYSPVSGETLLINDESASLLELLESGPSSLEPIAAQLADDVGLPVDAVAAIIGECLPALVSAGLIREGEAGSLP